MKSIEFFKQEMEGGIEILFYGTYQEDGDFGSFSKIIGKLSLIGEKYELFESDYEVLIWCKPFVKSFKDHDSELIHVDVEIIHV